MAKGEDKWQAKEGRRNALNRRGGGGGGGSWRLPLLRAKQLGEDTHVPKMSLNS